jgi:hypothetical protein
VALSDQIPKLGAQEAEEGDEPMSVIEKNAVPVVEVAHARAVDNDNGEVRTRTQEEYRALWQEIYERALAGGSSRDGARFIANERLVRIQADDAQVDPPGTGNYLSY